MNFHIRLILVLITAVLSGCAGTARQVAREATPGGVEGGIAELSKPENQKRLADVAAGPALENAGKSIARGVVSGTLSEFGLMDGGPATQQADVATQPSTTQQASPHSLGASVRDASGTFGQTVQTVADRLVLQISEQIRLIVRETVADSLKDGLSGGLRQGLSGAVKDVLADQAVRQSLTEASGAVAASAANATSEHLAAGIQNHLGPAIAQVIRKDLAPAIRTAIQEEVGPGIRQTLQLELGAIRTDSQLNPNGLQQFAGDTSRLMSREAALGLHDAMKQSGLLDASGRLAGQTGGAVRTGINFVWIAAIGAGLLAVALALWLWIVLAKSRKARDQAAEHDAAARRLAEAIERAQDQPWGNQLREHLRQHFKDRDLQAMLDPKPQG